MHSPLPTPHFTLYTLHFALYTLHSKLCTSHSTLCTLHSALYTPHPLPYTSHFTLYTVHSTLHTLHFTLNTLHTTSPTHPVSSHSTLCIPPPSTFHSLQCTGTVTGEKCTRLLKKIVSTKVLYVTSFGFVGCILFVFRICAILDWLQRRACKIQSVCGASVILVPHRFMGGIFPDCRDVHVSKPGWPHDLLLLGISWQDPNAEDGQQGEPVGNALYFLFGHLSTVARLLALSGVLFLSGWWWSLDAESHGRCWVTQSQTAPRFDNANLSAKLKVELLSPQHQSQSW